jgi:hypothetical protein
MTHKFKLMLPVLAVIAGVAASAFTVANTSYNANSKDLSYYWFNPSNTTYHDLNTVSNEESITGCIQQMTPICENGFTQTQLNNPNDPSQGVKSGATPATQINVKQ